MWKGLFVAVLIITEIPLKLTVQDKDDKEAFSV